ncbi:hypothetical protein [Pseudofrankia sp. BMG5.37]|uniref:hypothetical protein n=1 Tax=Pseudofrankia sp. BMG5.37 TaxID=3050035 RepID=UPI002894CA5A|nr:hypothetical protein [Pseudofrankia sp. BMG5.37]MDT3446897.1 hypothetical protein [Pseudofrankia sp. BMG5.37]
MLRAVAEPAGATGSGICPVFGVPRHGEHAAARVAALLDAGFLAEVGWDAARRLLSPPPGHRLLVRLVCRAAGCTATAAGGGVCVSCRRRLAEHGFGADEVALLPVRDLPSRGTGGCRLAGCAREWDTAAQGLCRAHADQRRALGLGMAEFLGHRQARPLPPCPPCGVTACPRQQRHRGGAYCAGHQIRLRVARRADPALDEGRWRMVEPAIGRGGEVSLRGLAPLVVAQVLFGLQQRCRVDGVKTKEADLRRVCDDLRRQQVTMIANYQVPDDREANFHALATTLAGHVRRALATPQTEICKDEWDLAVFGHGGTLSFTAISQRWLREAAKRWASDDLPRRRSKAGKPGLVVRHHLGCLARLSESLRMRDDRGETPAALGRADIEAFLHRLAYLESTGTITGDARLRACREVRTVLTRIRALGLTRPGGIAGGLGEDFAVHRDDIPAEPEPAEPNRDLPPEIMRQVCDQFGVLTSPEMRTAFSLAIDTGRRPEEIAALGFDCLARDADGAPLLVYTNHKANRLGRRLPIGENTAQLIVTQQQRVRGLFPDTPIAELALLPTDRRNPDGRRPVTSFTLSFHHRTWLGRMPALTTTDGVGSGGSIWIWR